MRNSSTDLKTESAPLVCIIVLNYNGCEHLEYCLPSLVVSDYDNYELLVVDNASSDGSVELIERRFSNVTLIRSKTNLGWSGGNNLGILKSLELGAKYIVLANNDIKVDTRWLAQAVAVAEEDCVIGVLGFKVIEPNDYPDQNDAFIDAQRAWTSVELSETKYVGGMSMFVRAELFEQIGLIDEGYFVYGEENDFQIRARKAGYKISAINIPVWHYGQGFFNKVPTRAARLQTRANIRLLIKHGSLANVFAALTHIGKRIVFYNAPQQTSAVEKRLRASSLSANLVNLVDGFVWNVWMLPKTLHRRSEDNRRAALAKRRWTTR